MRKTFSSVVVLLASCSLSAQLLDFPKQKLPKDRELLPITGHPFSYYEIGTFQLSGIDGAVVLLDSPKTPTAPWLTNNAFAKDVHKILLQQQLSQHENGGTEKETL